MNPWILAAVLTAPAGAAAADLDAGAVLERYTGLRPATFTLAAMQDVELSAETRVSLNWLAAAEALLSDGVEANAPDILRRFPASPGHDRVEEARGILARAVMIRMTYLELGQAAGEDREMNEQDAPLAKRLPELMRLLGEYERLPPAKRDFRRFFPRLIKALGAPWRPKPSPLVVYAGRLSSRQVGGALASWLPPEASEERSALRLLAAPLAAGARGPALRKAYADRASAELAAGRRNHALALVDRALRSGPPRPDLLVTRASILSALGRGAEARAALERALTLTDPDASDPAGPDLRRRILADLGR